MKSEKKLLMRELKWTMIVLSAAMLTLWFLFYIYMYNLLKHYVVENMEQVSTQIITELNRSFLQLEEVSFALSNEEAVVQLMKTEDSIEFHNHVLPAQQVFQGCSVDTSFINNLILYNEKGSFYRFAGNISNTGVQRMMNIIDGDEFSGTIQMKLDDTNYIGYVADITSENNSIGQIVMLTDANDLYRLFLQLSENEEMEIALAAGGEIIVSTEEDVIGKRTEEIMDNNSYLLHKQVGFTPFELLVSYENTNYKINYLFLAAMILMAFILLLILKVFLQLWKKKFFIPIQTVISEVEAFESGKSALLSLTGMEHFDGLVTGINDMVERVEQKEKEIFEATSSLQELEIKKQKAFIVSLKKQISAHFTINVLNIIKALSAMGENEKAGILCDGLSFLLRYANAGDKFISGMEEFFVLKKYTDIMEIRYPNRFVTDIDVVDYLDEVELPRMLLQPIVENSILHGFNNIQGTKQGLIRVYCGVENQTLRIIIEDNGSGIAPKQLLALMESIRSADREEDPIEGVSHVALINIQRRIRSYFGSEYGVVIEAELGKGTRVTVNLPVRGTKL